MEERSEEERRNDTAIAEKQGQPPPATPDLGSPL